MKGSKSKCHQFCRQEHLVISNKLIIDFFFFTFKKVFLLLFPLCFRKINQSENNNLLFIQIFSCILLNIIIHFSRIFCTRHICSCVINCIINESISASERFNCFRINCLKSSLTPLSDPRVPIRRAFGFAVD